MPQSVTYVLNLKCHLCPEPVPAEERGDRTESGEGDNAISRTRLSGDNLLPPMPRGESVSEPEGGFFAAWPPLSAGVDLKRVTSYGTHLSDGARARNAADDRVSSFYDQSSCRMRGLA